MQTLNCYNSVNIAATLTKVLLTHSAAHDASIRVTAMTQKKLIYNESTYMV